MVEPFGPPDSDRLDTLIVLFRDLSSEEQQEAMARLMAAAPLEARKAGVRNALMESVGKDGATKELITEAVHATSDQEVGEVLKKAAEQAAQVLTPEAKKDVAAILGAAATDSINRLAEAEPGDVQELAASQITLLASYYKAVLDQAKMSFRWALIAAGIGLVFFLGAVFFLLTRQSEAIATVSIISGALVEVIAGINFYLYNSTSAQLAAFHHRLEQTQRYLLANSICEALQGDRQQETRATLIHTIANPAINLETAAKP